MVGKASVALCVMACVSAVLGFGEPDAFGHPNYVEQANLVFVNAVRIAPVQYKSVFGYKFGDDDISTTLVTYAAAAPLYWEPQLGQSAYAHSLDMGQTPCFSHDSCDKTSIWTRIGSYFNCDASKYSGLGENIAAGVADPWDVNTMWLCDGNGNACAPDGNGDGHRSNIMGSGYTAIGIGYAYTAGSPFGAYSTQDFTSNGCAPWTNPIYSGAHYKYKDGTVGYLTVFYQAGVTASPRSAQVVVNGQAFSMSLVLGSGSQGFYSYNGSTIAAAAGCQSYYFQFVDSTGVTARFPDTGSYQTYGQGGCQVTWTGSPATPAPTPTPAPTSSTPTTTPTTGTPSDTPTDTPTPTTPTLPVTLPPTVKPIVTYPVYIGCYIDAVGRDLGLRVNDSDIPYTSMTVASCEAVCLKKGYAYAGLQNGQQCWCGNKYGTYGAASAPTQCYKTCRGRTSDICGGKWRNSIYQVKDAPASVVDGQNGNNAGQIAVTFFAVIATVAIALF